jgi:formylglycine-generating enzyme required for sulfatase activity
MHGNVWEWCWDLYDLYFEARVAPVPLTNPTRSDDGVHRINRGGGWESPGKHLRSAARSGDFPETADGSMGFRLARNEN